MNDVNREPDEFDTFVVALRYSLRMHPQLVADTLKAVRVVAERLVLEGRFADVTGFADRLDAAVEEARKEGDISPSAEMETMTMLCQNTFAILAIMGQSEGKRDSGGFRASLAHAERLDASTGGVLRLVELVEMIEPD